MRIGYFGGGIPGINLTFGWVLLINTFIRNLTLITVIQLLIENLGVAVAALSLVFGFNGVLLALYQPYKDWEISLAPFVARKI